MLFQFVAFIFDINIIILIIDPTFFLQKFIEIMILNIFPNIPIFIRLILQFWGFNKFFSKNIVSIFHLIPLFFSKGIMLIFIIFILIFILLFIFIMFISNLYIVISHHVIILNKIALIESFSRFDFGIFYQLLLLLFGKTSLWIVTLLT